jgi:phosphoribosylanthranilate isomerase
MESDRFAIKVCGMRDGANIEAVASLAPDYMGFIFYPKSLRYAGEMDPGIISRLPKSVTPVGVFVNESKDSIISTAKRFHITTLQLHGNETPRQCQELRDTGYTVIKAVAINEPAQLSELAKYQNNVDLMLFDTTGKDVNGGTGKKWDWQLIENYPLKTPFMLSGGISSDDVDKIIAARQPMMAGADVNSRFEISPGIKDVDKLSKFINSLRKTL